MKHCAVAFIENVSFQIRQMVVTQIKFSDVLQLLERLELDNRNVVVWKIDSNLLAHWALLKEPKSNSGICLPWTCAEKSLSLLWWVYCERDQLDQAIACLWIFPAPLRWAHCKRDQSAWYGSSFEKSFGSVPLSSCEKRKILWEIECLSADMRQSVWICCRRCWALLAEILEKRLTEVATQAHNATSLGSWLKLGH